MSRYSVYFFILPILLFLHGCSTVKTQEPPVLTLESPQAVEHAWESHRAKMLSVKTWQVSGRAGIVSTQPKHSGVVSIEWQQMPHDKYSLVLTGPLGQVVGRIEGGKGYVILFVPGRRIMRGNNADTLLFQQTGWHIPVSRLAFWVKGVPAPGDLSGMSLDNQGRLANINQSGWNVFYSDYAMVANKYILPTRIRLVGEHVTVKLILSWDRMAGKA